MSRLRLRLDTPWCILLRLPYLNYSVQALNHHLEHLSSGRLYPIPNASITSLSLSSHVRPSPSKSNPRPPSARMRTPLESNFHPCAFFAYRRRSRSKVVSPDQPNTAHPTVRQGEMMMSTRRWGFGFRFRLDVDVDVDGGDV